ITREADREIGLIGHAEGDLLTQLKWNKRLREIDPIRAQAEQETGARWEDLSDSAKSYWRMKIGHPGWQVRPNLFTDMTGSIIEESQSQDVQIFFNLVYGYIAHSVTAPSVTAPPGGPGPGPVPKIRMGDVKSLYDKTALSDLSEMDAREAYSRALGKSVRVYGTDNSNTGLALYDPDTGN